MKKDIKTCERVIGGDPKQFEKAVCTQGGKPDRYGEEGRGGQEESKHLPDDNVTNIDTVQPHGEYPRISRQMWG